jgi:hypothetical protein
MLRIEHYKILSPSSQFLRSLHYMGYLERVLEKIKEWAERVIEVLLGPVAEPETEAIPVPVDDRYRRR